MSSRSYSPTKINEHKFRRAGAASATGTCLSAADAVGGDSGRSSRPVAAASRAAGRAGGQGARDGSFPNEIADNDDEEEEGGGGGGGLESRAARSVLLSGVQRWCLDVSEWELSADQWDGLLGLLPNAESARVRAFLRENDRKLALGSRLLQRAVVSKVFGLEFHEVDIRRTSESKPFFAGVSKAIEDGSVSPLLKNWNFNVSHHGKYVAIASEPACLCGMDVVDTNRRANEQGPAVDYLQYFTGHFTDDEWATIKSTPFRDRRGTPRQGSITPLSRGKVTLDRAIVGYPALIGMTDFSHIWLVFVFHDNTNATVNGVAEERPMAAAAAASAAGEDGERKGAQAAATAAGSTEGVRVKGQLERWGGGAREYRRPRHKLRQTFLTKVCPPRLGKRIGVLGTRSPHRPNPLGLTMVKLDGVDLKTNSITVSGIDLVDGTPIIDIKPVVPHDVPRNMRVPEWVEDDPCLRRVVFTEEACEGLSKCVGEEARKSKSKFYEDVESFKAAASEVLVQDVRSVHQGRGLASDELYECCFDGVIMFFVTTELEMRVVSAG